MRALTMKNIANKQQQGFTLIELVIVIVILGILAATAAPKFIDLTGDARSSVMSAVQGSINSATSIAHSKALIAGKTSGTDTIVIGSKYYALVNGYPAAQSLGAKDGTSALNALGIKGLVELESGSDVTVDETNNPAVFTHSKATTPASCKVDYTESTGSEVPPTVTLTSSGC